MNSNPCTYFTTGSDSESFTHEGGKTFYNFSSYGSGISEFMDYEVNFFADSVEHAKDILTRALKFKAYCARKMIKDAETRIDTYNSALSISRAKRDIEGVEELLAGKDKWLIEEAPTNQLFKASWACNDTI